MSPSSTCFATSRRKCWPFSSGDFATSPPRKTRCRRPSSQARRSGRATVCPRARAPGLDDPRDRARVPGARGDDGPADQPGEAEHQGLRRRLRRAGSQGRDGTPRGRHARPLSHLQRGLCGELGAGAGSHRPLGRSAAPHAHAPSRGPRRRRGGRAPRAHAPHGRTSRRTNRRIGRAHPARPPGPDVMGPRRDRRGSRAPHCDATARPGRPLSGAGGDRRLTLDVRIRSEIRAAAKAAPPADFAPAGMGLLPKADEYIVTSGALDGHRGYFSRDASGAVVGIDLAGRLFKRARST